MGRPAFAAEAFPLDAQLLVLFDTLYRVRSVSLAAQELDLAQPTASIWLARLRRRLHDPLFVRGRAGMQPTSRATALIVPAREALRLLRHLTDPVAGFEPATSERSYRLAMTDASHITLLPRILARVRAAAPRVRLEVTPIGSDTERSLASGDTDLALGFVPGIGPAFHAQALYDQTFVCLASATHPRLARGLSLMAYRREGHIGILSSASYAMLQKGLRQAGVERRMVLELPGFLGLAAVISSTDLIATVPSTIGEALAESAALRLLPCPVRLPVYTVRQYWHERARHDPAHRWLRALCADLFGRPSAKRLSTGARPTRATRPGSS